MQRWRRNWPPRVARAIASARAIPAPFDQAILGDDRSPGRRAVAATIQAVRALGDLLARAGTVLGLARPGGRGAALTSRSVRCWSSGSWRRSGHRSGRCPRCRPGALPLARPVERRRCRQHGAGLQPARPQPAGTASFGVLRGQLVLQQELDRRAGVGGRPRRAGPAVQRALLLGLPLAATGAAGRPERRRAAAPACSCASACRATSPTAAPRPDPGYGDQIQTLALPGVPARGRRAPRVAAESPGSYADGERLPAAPSATACSPTALRRARARSAHLARVAPAMVGLGLLEAVPESALLALADPDDRGRRRHLGAGQLGAGIGRSGQRRIGRFGWKAEQPSVLQQTAAAFLGDMGITSSLFPEREPHAGARAGAHSARPGACPRSAMRSCVRWRRTCACWRVPARADRDPAGTGSGARRCFEPPAAPAATYRSCRPVTPPTCPSWPGRRSGPTPTCCCTTWASGLGGPASGVRGERPRVAHAAAVGPGADRRR